MGQRTFETMTEAEAADLSLDDLIMVRDVDVEAPSAEKLDVVVAPLSAIKEVFNLGTAADVDVDTDVTLAANSDVRVATQKAVKAYCDALIAAANATVYKGVTDCSSNPNYPAADAGWLYRVSVSGKIGGASGVVVQAGDMFICLADSTASGNQATVGASWNVVQANIDGAVIGPTSVTDGNFPLYDGTTGKLLKTSAFSPSSFQAAAAMLAKLATLTPAANNFSYLDGSNNAALATLGGADVLSMLACADKEAIQEFLEVGGGGDLSAAVILAPDNSARNVIQAANAATTPLSIKNVSGAGVTYLLEFQNYDGAVVAGVGTAGDIVGHHLTVNSGPSAPIVTNSSVLCTNLNADMVDGKHVGSGANELVALNGSGELPALNGSNLTNVNAATLGSKSLATIESDYASAISTAVAAEAAARDAAIAAALTAYLQTSGLAAALAGLGGTAGTSSPGGTVTANSSGLVTAVT